MADEKKIGAGMAAHMARLGLEELRSAAVQQPQAPSAYEAALNSAAARAQTQQVDRGQGMSR